MRAPYSDQDTSKEAAESIEPHLARMEKQVLDEIRLFSMKYTDQNMTTGEVTTGCLGRTDEEIEDATGLKHQTASARRRELVLKGLVEHTGEYRRTRSGRRAKVWRVKE